MAFFLGKDVAVACSTENQSQGLTIAAAGTFTTPVGGTFATDLNTASPDGAAWEQITSVDLSIGAMDEDITYFGMRTALKAEIKKETSLTLTRKKSDPLMEYVFDKLRYGLTGTTVGDASIMDGLEQPTLEYGYRAYVHLSGTSEVMTIPNCVVTSHSVTINSDGTTDESIELMSMVTPVVSGANYATPTLQANL